MFRILQSDEPHWVVVFDGPMESFRVKLESAVRYGIGFGTFYLPSPPWSSTRRFEADKIEASRAKYVEPPRSE